MKIVFTEAEGSEQPFFESELAGHEVVFAESLEEVDPNTEVLSVYIHTVIDAEFLDRHSRLKLIATRSTGYDHIDVNDCVGRGISISNVSGADANAVAEHSLTLMLAVSRRLQEVHEANKQPYFYYERLRARDLRGRTIGIVGTGRIGLHVVRLALAFGMKALAYELYRKSLMAEIMGVRYVSFEELLSSSDVISLHVPLTAETYHILNRDAFAQMKPGVVIINTARGGLIDTTALVDALDSGVVAGVGIDVLEDERVMRKEGTSIIADQIIERLQSMTHEEERIQNPERIQELQTLVQNQQLLSRRNVFFTPHVAFNSVEAVEQINATTVESIRAFLAGNRINLVAANKRNQFQQA